MNRLLLVLCFLVLTPSLAAADGPRRVAVVVGANAAAPGRARLRYAQSDARALATTLRDASGLAARDIDVLLDPDPDEVLAALDRRLHQLATEPEGSMLVFYYSGHADDRALYPNGRALSWAAVRERLESPRASVRIGIVDACRGGSWTGTRGLTETEVFEVDPALGVRAEGSVLIASSSGLEDAHESETIEGGFFTHHWNAGLRGAGDGDGDGSVSLLEAFDYAKRLTIRDTAMQTSQPQHPSFHMNLAGRGQVVLAQPARAESTLALAQDRGPLEVIHLDSGVVVLELPPGRQVFRVTVPAGRYLVRSVVNGQRRGREVEVVARGTVRLAEAELELAGSDQLSVRSREPRPIARTSLPEGAVQLSLAAGVQHSDVETGGLSVGEGATFTIRSRYGITDRLEWEPLSLALSYRFGDDDDFELVASTGVLGFRIGASSLNGLMVDGPLGASADAVIHLDREQSLLLGAGFYSRFRIVADETETLASYGPESWRARLFAGYSYTIADAVTLSAAVSYGHSIIVEGEAATDTDAMLPTISFGAVQSYGLRSPPLVRVHLSDSVALDAYVDLTWDFANENLTETYLFGTSLVF